jgi:hypothetical protein
MNKNKIIMAVMGGVAAVVAVGCAVMIWMAADECDEALMEREGRIGECQNNAGVDPEDAKTYDKNRETLIAWADEASKFVAEKGRRSLDAGQDPAAFKQQMVEDARHFREEPKDSKKKIVKEDFDFGFKEYVNEGAMPSQAAMPVLQRKWDDIYHFIDLMLKSGVTEVTAIKADLDAAQPADDQPRRGRGAAKKEATPAEAYPSSPLSYEIEFLARPAALVATLNAFASDFRFITVDSLSFAQAGDPLGAKLGGDKEKEGGEGGGRRGRRGRRGRAVEEEQPQTEQEDEIAKKGLVTDPASTIPFTVKIRVSTLDFTSKGEDGK